jgi:hypothetical protein
MIEIDFQQTNSSQPDNASATPANRAQICAASLTINSALALHCVEGIALVMLCQCRATPRKLAINLLKELKSMLLLMPINVRSYLCSVLYGIKCNFCRIMIDR